LFRRFRETFQYGFSGGISLPVSEQVGFGLSYGYQVSTTNIKLTGQELLNLEDILASPIPVVGGDYRSHTLSISFNVVF
jgi:hypothetical protein